MADASAEAGNQRTHGRWTPANKAPGRGLTKEEKHAKSVPTIPSRYEVTLYKGDREYYGFGSRAMRFEHNAFGEAPGPGEYGRQKAFHEECTENVSWGIRGTGGFASRSQRFRILPSNPRPGRGCPGPGAYRADSAMIALKNQSNFNQAPQSGSFAPHNLEKAASSSALVPGPGHYVTTGTVGGLALPGAEAAFKDKSQRGPAAAVLRDAEEFPGPGEYYDPVARALGSDASERLGIPAGEPSTVSFKEPSRRRVVRVHPDLPAPQPANRELLGNFAEEVGHECKGTESKRSLLPGPGHYDQDRDAIWDPGLVGVAGSSSFQHGPQRTNWAKKEVLGPGKYDPKREITVPDQITSACSAFTSGSERNKLQFPAAPGPAYYSPAKPKATKSFMLNAKRHFVP